MDGQTIDIIVMIAYLACVVLIGYYSMNQIEDFDDYAWRDAPFLPPDLRHDRRDTVRRRSHHRAYLLRA